MDKVKVTKERLDEIAKDCLVDFLEKMLVESDDITRLVVAKNADYGDAWQRFDIFTPLVRINDKLLRVINLSDGKKALVADENIKDTLKDTVGYALLALLKMKYGDETHKVTVEEELLKNLPTTSNFILPADPENVFGQGKIEK